MASTTFDFPQPFGPTMALMPLEKMSFVLWGNDLNPKIVMELSRISCVFKSEFQTFFILPNRNIWRTG